MPSTFLSPGRVVHGPDTAAELGSLLRLAGCPAGSVLLVTDRGVASTGLLEAPRLSLEAAGYEVTVFSELAAEPDLAIATKAVERARGVKPVAVIGVGGGSAMDLAKVAALGASNPGGVADLATSSAQLRLPVPLFQLPTTAGTGSEATRVAVLNGIERKLIIVHPGLVSTVAVLDPELTVGLPAAATASTGLDAMTHAIESFLSLDASALTEVQSLAALQRLTAILPTVVNHGSGLGHREDALIGAYQAGLSLNAGVVVGHSIAYTIAKRSHLPHGVTTAMALPYCLVYNASRTAERQQILSNTFRAAGRLVTSTPAQAFAELNRELGIPSNLEQVGIAASAIEQMADECIRNYPRTNNPEPMTMAGLSTLLGFMLAGDLTGYERQAMAVRS
jgi:alcohol dehydrogenase class IV